MRARPTPSHRTPLQDRSRATLARILNAAEELLVDRPFADVPITEITDRAGTSVGAFYARFESKAGLLAAIVERYRNEYLVRAARELASEEWKRLSLDELVPALVRYFVTSYRRHRGMFRTMYFGLRSRPEGVGAELRDSVEAVVALCIDLVMQCLASEGIPTTRERVDFAIFSVLVVCREAVALGFDNPDGLTDEQVTNQVSEMALFFLERPTPGGPGPGHESRAPLSSP